MKWLGQWRNQFGSVVDITDETGHAIADTFQTAPPDGGFYGQTTPSWASPGRLREFRWRRADGRR